MPETRQRLSKRQWALLGVLYLRARPINELAERWPGNVHDTVRKCVALGLVTWRGTFVELTNAGHSRIEVAAEDVLAGRAMGELQHSERTNAISEPNR